MKYRDKDIAILTNAELVDAAFALNAQYVKFQNIQNDPRYLKKFINQPPPSINPDFIELKNEVYKEITKRGI